MRRTLFATAAFAAALTAAACSKPANQAAADNAVSNTEAASSNTEMNATSGASAKGNDAVDVAQDAASSAVGVVSAAAGSLTSQAFVDAAAQSDMYEVAASKLAVQRSHSARIKAFAAKMIAAHTKTTTELKAIVKSGDAGNVTPPAALDDRHQGLIDNLKSASADDFDARFLDQQANAHKEAEQLMSGYAKAGSNAQLKAFAAKTAPVVQTHIDMVKALDVGNADKDNKTGDGGAHA